MRSLLLSVCLCLSLSSLAFAQSVQVIPWQDSGGNFLVNSIITFMEADTNAAGEQLNDIYKLEMGGNYLLDQTVTLRNDIYLTADDYDRNDPNLKPPVVRIVTQSDGTPSTGLFFNAFANFKVENIYFAGMGTGDVWMNGNWLSVQAPDIEIRMAGCMFDYMGWSIITNFAHEGVSYVADNVYIKNNINAGDPYSPFFVLSVGPAVKSFIARNCTYFQSHGMFMQARNPVEYVEIDHCTFVNNLKMQIFNENLTNARITNNVFYNTLAIGETPTENADKDRDGLSWSIVNVDTLPGNEPGGTDPIMPEDQRQLIVRNNVWHRTPAVEQFHSTNGLIAGPFMNSRTQDMFNNDTDWPGLDEANNMNEDPAFGSFIDEASDSMFSFMNAFRGISGTTSIWGFETDRNEFPTLFRVNVEWPLVEDFEHNISMLGTDGLPLGDLSWYENIATGIENDPSEVIANFILEQNYPNPFNPETTIRYHLRESNNVTLAIFDVTGKLVRTLVSGERQAIGSYQARWDGKNDSGITVPSGVYFYRLNTAEAISASRKMLLVK